MIVYGLFGLLNWDLCIKLCVGEYEAENGHGTGFKKWNKCWMSGLPMDSPHALFWDCENSPGFV